MKKSIRILFAIAMLASFHKSFAQTNAQDTMRRYYSKLAASANEADKALLREKLYGLLQSGKEEDWNTAANFFYGMKRSTSDSIRKATMAKFPMGMAVRGAEAGNVKKAVEYANMTETGPWKGEGWAGPATRLQKAGYPNEAMVLYKKAIANAYKYMTTNREEYGAGFAATGYPGYNNSVAEILMGQKKYAEALPYLREAHDSSKTVKAYVNANYAKALMALGRNEEAFDKIDEAVKAGQSTPEMKEMLKTLYAKLKGSGVGYDEYMVALNKHR